MGLSNRPELPGKWYYSAYFGALQLFHQTIPRMCFSQWQSYDRLLDRKLLRKTISGEFTPDPKSQVPVGMRLHNACEHVEFRYDLHDLLPK